MSKGYSICSNLIIKILQQCHWRNSGAVVISFRHDITSHLLLFTLHAKWCNYTEVEIQSTAPHFIELLSRQFFRNSPKITNQLFFKSFFGWLLWQTSGISFESVPHGATRNKICLFLYDFKNFKKTEGRRVSCFAL